MGSTARRPLFASTIASLGVFLTAIAAKAGHFSRFQVDNSRTTGTDSLRMVSERRTTGSRKAPADAQALLAKPVSVQGSGRANAHRGRFESRGSCEISWPPTNIRGLAGG